MTRNWRRDKARTSEGFLIPAKWVNNKTGKYIHTPLLNSSLEQQRGITISYLENLEDFSVTQEFEEFMNIMNNNRKEYITSQWFYVICKVNSPFKKIGITTSGRGPDKRLSQLQTGNPELLEIEMVIQCVSVPALTLEKRMKIALEEFREKGEWYRVSFERENLFYQILISTLDSVEEGGLYIYPENISFSDMYKIHSCAENKHFIKRKWSQTNFLV